MEFGVQFWSVTFNFLGKVLLGVMALLVHKKLMKEHRVDRIVIKELKLESSIGAMAIIMFIVGYVLELIWINN